MTLFCSQRGVGLGPCVGEVLWRSDRLHALCEKHFESQQRWDEGAAKRTHPAKGTKRLTVEVLDVTDTPNDPNYIDAHSDDDDDVRGVSA